jgi:hypothetical protein
MTSVFKRIGLETPSMPVDKQITGSHRNIYLHIFSNVEWLSSAPRDSKWFHDDASVVDAAVPDVEVVISLVEDSISEGDGSAGIVEG